MIRIKAIDSIHFTASVPCGKAWPGMRHTPDVGIITDRALDHLGACGICLTVAALAQGAPLHSPECDGQPEEWPCRSDCPARLLETPADRHRRG